MTNEFFDKDPKQNKSLSLFFGLLLICVAVFLFGLKTGRFKINKSMKSDELFVHSLMESFPRIEPYLFTLLGRLGNASENAEDFYWAFVDITFDDPAATQSTLSELAAFLSERLAGKITSSNTVRVYEQKHSSKDSQAFFETFFEGISESVTSEEANVINNVNGVLLVEKVLNFEVSGEELNAALDVAHVSSGVAELQWVYSTIKACFDKVSKVTGKLYINEKNEATGIVFSAELKEEADSSLMEVAALINSLSDNVGYRFEITREKADCFVLNGSGKLDPKSGELDSDGTLLLGSEEFSISTDDLSVRSMPQNNAAIMLDGTVTLASVTEPKTIKLDLGYDGRTREVIVLEIENDMLEKTASVTIK